VRKITFGEIDFQYRLQVAKAPRRRQLDPGDAIMKSKSSRVSTFTSRAGKSCFLGLFLSLFAGGAALAQYQGTPSQRRACTPDVYRLCAGEIPNVRAITACLRRNKGSLSDACRAAFDQAAQ
jgi:hypothetical protein